MIKEIKLPEVSDNVETGDVLKVLVKVGDKIEIDQPLVELETEKATFEVPSTESGVVKEINVKEGDTIKIGALILTLESNGEGEKKTGKSENKESEVKDKDLEEKGSDKNAVKTDSTDKGKREGEDIEDDKSEGHKKSEGREDAKVEKEEKSDEKEAKSEENGEDNTEEKDEKKEKEKSEEELSGKKDEKSDGKDIQKKDEKKGTENVNPVLSAASPSVRRLARELGVDINAVPSSDSSDRITEEDIKHYVKAKLSSPSGISVIQKSLPDFKQWGEIEIEPMTKIRTITAESMTYAWTTIPMVTQFDKADITHLEEFRKKNLKKVEEAGGHLTITSILVKVCEAALRSFPQFNSSIDLQKKEIIYKKYYNIGVAVDTNRGLLVPVIKDADKKNIKEISKELNELAEKARNKKITPAEMEGGNFTISNLGGIGGTAFSPIVYPPQVAILGVSRGSKDAVYINEKFEPRLMLPLSLTYDHRIIDGADAVRFLRWVCEALENPISMMI